MRLASLAVLSAALFAASCGDNGNGARGTPDASGGLCPVPVDCNNPACATDVKCRPDGGGEIDGGIANPTPICGDGHVDNGEVCDDGNKVDGDGCDSTCTVTGCGNGVTTTGEACDDGNLVDGDGCDRNCTRTACGNGITTGAEACDDGNTANWDGCDNACTQSVFTYVKASNTNAGDTLGSSVAISADGSTLVVGAPQEASDAVGVNGDQTSNAAKGAGAVYVFVRTGTAWTQQAYLKASNTGANDQFGFSVAVSADGSTVAVGATEEDSGDPADPANNAAIDAGAVYVFARANGTWTQ
ncbi:MAG TPA: DUF4215 domain-containing protein [Kofleriaceae bacterium]|nr:DUF4215 domain-containing protein [Kofleriaceae bacterium]